MSALSDAQDQIQKAYEATIEFLSWRKRSYQQKFPNRASDTILMDLARFCHVNEDCPYTDPFKLGEWLGMQKVFRRISRHLELSTEELFALYSGVRQNKENRS